MKRVSLDFVVLVCTRSL